MLKEIASPVIFLCNGRRKRSNAYNVKMARYSETISDASVLQLNHIRTYKENAKAVLLAGTPQRKNVMNAPQTRHGVLPKINAFVLPNSHFWQQTINALNALHQKCGFQITRLVLNHKSLNSQNQSPLLHLYLQVLNVRVKYLTNKLHNVYVLVKNPMKLLMVHVLNVSLLNFGVKVKKGALAALLALSLI